MAPRLSPLKNYRAEFLIQLRQMRNWLRRHQRDATSDERFDFPIHEVGFGATVRDGVEQCLWSTARSVFND